MATYNKIQQFIEDVFHGVHDFSADALEVCLTVAEPTAATDAVLLDLTPISYTNLSTRVITADASGRSGATYTLSLTDLTLTASGGAVAAFQYITVFNQDSATPTDALICYFDYGSSLTLQDGESLTIDWGSDGPTTGNLFTAT